MLSRILDAMERYKRGKVHVYTNDEIIKLAEKEIESLRGQNNKLEEENARLRSLIEKCFYDDDYLRSYPHSKPQFDEAWEQFKNDNNI